MADYLSREEILRAFGNLTVKNPDDKYQHGMQDAIDCLIPEVINGMESADVQPIKHGKWESSQRTIETGTVYCSNCAIEYYISDLQTVGDCNGIIHYCPNCGARMDGDTNG